ncbi:MAG: chorismate synthase [Rikenellaceae bacterium]|jgi:chorismate synthase|nr:chorismate synthase [Rikenellaceae bacterium]
MNSFGRRLRVSILGESHGEMIGVVLDGVPPGLPLSVDDFKADIDRRRSGAKGTTPRVEADEPQIVAGIFEGHTTGAPLAILFANTNTRSGDYANLTVHPRPSHADWVAQQRFGGFADYRGGGHFSGRITLPLVAAGVVAKKMISVRVEAHITQIGGESDPARFDDVVAAAMKNGDSVGGIVECRAEGVPVGLGEPFFDSAESIISHLLFSIPAVKGVEFGLGFGSAILRGSENNDPIISPDGTTATNHAGGIAGGLTNGNPLVVRVAIKPTASISAPQQTLNTATGQVEELRIRGRHDACIALRAPVVVEAAVAIALADLNLLKQ